MLSNGSCPSLVNYCASYLLVEDSILASVTFLRIYISTFFLAKPCDTRLPQGIATR